QRRVGCLVFRLDGSTPGPAATRGSSHFVCSFIEPLKSLGHLVNSGELEELKLQLPNAPQIAIHRLFESTGPQMPRTNSFGNRDSDDWKDAGTIGISYYKYALYKLDVAMIKYLTRDVLLNSPFFTAAKADDILKSSKDFMSKLIQDAYSKEKRCRYQEILSYLNHPKQQENIAQIRMAARNLLRLRGSDSPVFSTTPDRILANIASFCGDRSIHDEEESQKIAFEHLNLRLN
ncbi:MAG: hypothetical protein HKM04_04500, partial [Legionellales bacterium]|nr:hypothetical protein [Legionellales bacterium]